MCGLPTETDEDVLQIAELAKKVIATGREVVGPQRHPLHGVASAGSCPSRTRRSSGPPSCDHETIDARLAKLRDAVRSDREVRAAPSASATTTASRASSKDCCRAATAGSGAVIERGLARRRPVRRLERALLVRPLDGCAGDGAGGPAGVDVDWYTTREREYAEVLPWDHLDSGLDKDWLWEDWQDARQRGRGRGLPLDAVLRLRRLPADGHRHPDRPDRHAPCCRCRCRASPTAGPSCWRRRDGGAGAGARPRLARGHRGPGRLRGATHDREPDEVFVAELTGWLRLEGVHRRTWLAEVDGARSGTSALCSTGGCRRW